MSNPSRAVVVTGCSSGIGRAIAVHLARAGEFLVFATTRRSADARALERLNLAHLVPVPNTDLTRRDQIEAAVGTVRWTLLSKSCTGLHAIVNNAGGGVIAPLELLDMGFLERELKTRIIGAATLVQRLLPEIRRAKGRLLWITTPGPIPLAYKSSVHVPEFALHGLARTFRIELSPWKIPSILIACGGVRSHAVGRMDRQLSETLQKLTEDQLALYGPALRAVLERDQKIAESGIDAERVAEKVEQVLRSPNPKPLYKVGLSKALASMSSLPGSRVDDFFISLIKSGTPIPEGRPGLIAGRAEPGPRRSATRPLR